MKTGQMIDSTKKRLTFVFLSVFLSLQLVNSFATVIFINYSVKKTIKAHARESFLKEFLPLYEKRDLATLNNMIEDELFQIFDKEGELQIAVKTSLKFDPPVNRSSLRKAIMGNEVYETNKHGETSYITYYARLDDEHGGRTTLSLDLASGILDDYLKIMLLTLPVLLIASWIITYYLVRQSLAPLIRLMTFQETFSSNISHEINTPLTAIKGNFEVILKKERSAFEYRETIKSALKSINGLISITNALYILAKSKFMPLELLKERVDMNLLIDEVIEKFEPVIVSKEQALDLSIGPDLICDCDPSLFRTAIENILGNAVKYTQKKGVIGVKVFKEGNNCILKISNTSSGITQAELASFFKPFFRRKKGHNKYVEGVGLGLYIVQHIIQSHQGSINAQIDNGVLSFTITIPMN